MECPLFTQETRLRILDEEIVILRVLICLTRTTPKYTVSGPHLTLPLLGVGLCARLVDPKIEPSNKRGPFIGVGRFKILGGQGLEYWGAKGGGGGHRCHFDVTCPQGF